MPNPLLLAGMGANLISRFAESRAQEAQAKRLRARMLANLDPLEAQILAYRMAPTQGEGLLINQAGQQAAGQLAGAGLGQSSFVTPAVAGAVAPILEQRETNTYNRLADLAGMKNAIYANTSTPGFGASFGGFLGDTGSLLTGMAGQQDETDQLFKLIGRIRGLYGGATPGASAGPSPAQGAAPTQLGWTPPQYAPVPPELQTPTDAEAFVTGFHDQLQRQRRRR